MKKTPIAKRFLSMLMAILMAVTGLIPAAQAFAADGVEGYYDIELFYKDSDTIVPSTMLNDKGEEVNYIEYMVEGDELALTYKFIDTVVPDNSYIKWYSETPQLVDVTQEGVVKAFDSSKGAVVHAWINNEVKTIPLVGSIIATVLEKALFNDYVDVDTMDTDAIIAIVEAAFGSDSLLDKWIESYKGELIDSLRYYLDNINSNIHVQLFAADGTLLDDDYVQICVTRNNEWYANFLPNGTHITNKSQINTTVGVGSSVQLYGITTPVRLEYGCIYTVKSSSIFQQGKVVATVDDSGLVTFKNPGTVTIMVTPDTEQVIQNILKLVNYFYEINTEMIDSKQLADILIKYVGLDINRNVLAGILDTIFAIVDIAGDAADPVKLTASAVKIIANLVLQFAYNDSITFTVVEAQPLTDFKIEGATSVREGSQIQLEITDIQPSMGDVSDITWRSSDPTVASVDPKTGVITGRDAGGSLGALSSQQCTIYATSAANNIERPYTITVTGKTGRYISDVVISGESYLEMGMETDYTFEMYPKRVAQGDNLYFNWGIITGTDEDGNPIYAWADGEAPATDGRGEIDELGHYTVISGGISTIALKAQTGYYLSNGTFFEISSYISTFEVANGIPVDRIDISVTDNTGTGKIRAVNDIEINGEKCTYVSINASIAYFDVGAIVNANVYPANATNQNLTWVVDNGYYNTSVSDNTHTATVKQKANHENADTFNIYAVSADGAVKSNVITVCVAKNNVTENIINEEAIVVTRGKTADATHSIKFDGSSGTYSACYKCNWYSSDESIFTVKTKNNDNRDATITALDVGTATLTCVSADGGVIDTCEVTVLPDKDYLRSIVNLCDKTVIRRTSENAKLYKEYMSKLDLAYTVLYHKDMASQTVCDTTADELLYAFYRLGGFIGLNSVNIVDKGGKVLADDYVTVNVGSVSNYTNYSYDFDFVINPKTAMYSHVTWTSSSSDIKVDSNGVCKPKSNDACSAIITCTVTDYMGGTVSDSVQIAFSRTPATGVTLNTTNIEAGLIGETAQLSATVLPTATLGVGGASNSAVKWSSSDEEIATVDSNGLVTFREGGNCIITATTLDGGYTASCAVNVVTNYTALELLVQQYNDLSLNSINYYPDSWEIYTNAMAKAQKILNVRKSSQNEVDAMYAELQEAYNTLQKYNYLQKIELYLDGEQTQEFYQYDLSLLSEGISYTNAVLDLNVRLYPNNGSYAPPAVWSSSTSDISVTTDGKCSPTANKSCYGMITCTVNDHYGNTFSDSVWVSFSYFPVTALLLSKNNISGAIGDTEQLAVTVEPTGTDLLHIGAASIQDYFWESDDESIASVNQNGLVTFNGTGSTIIRAVSYDGGVFAECRASGDGDRTALMKAIDDYGSTDYTAYEYTYGMAFVQALDEAKRAMTDSSYTQERIDLATSNLISAYEEMIKHPCDKIEGVEITYTTTKDPTFGKATQVASGTISGNDSLSINLSKDYADYNYNNWATLTAVPSPNTASYKSAQWSVLSSKDVKTTITNNSIEVKPTERKTGGWAKLSVTLTDYYGNSVSRNVNVALSDKVCTNFDITESAKTIYTTTAPSQLAYTVSGSPEFTDIIWTSSDESVVTVDQNGTITPVEKGSAKITAKTLDGGYSDSVTITVLTDFSQLAAKYDEYYTLIQSVGNEYTYTEESLSRLSAAVNDAQTMINEGRATQAEVNEMITKLDDAFNSLVLYVPVRSVAVSAYENNYVSVVNEGFIRYTDTSINNKQIMLKPVFNQENAVYTSIKWESSNPDITVDEEGILTNTSASGGVTKVTCTCMNIFGKESSGSAYISFARYGVKSISFADEMVHGSPSSTVTLKPSFTGTGTVSSFVSITDCLYSSSDPSIASVDENGVVTFQTQGEAIITATSLDGGYTATITAFTTWDTNALKAAIEEAAKINYQNYAYEYGTAFNNAYQDAQQVIADIYASQAEIDTACTILTEAMSELEGHEFIKPEISFVQGDLVLNNDVPVQVDANTLTATVSAKLNDGAMVKSLTVTSVDGENATSVVNGSDVIITKSPDADGTVTVNAVAVDDYDREYTLGYTLNIIDKIVPVTSFVILNNGSAVGSTLTASAGGKYANFAGIPLEIVTTPANANSYKVEWTSSNSTYIEVKDNVLQLTTLGKAGIAASRTAKITCTITNNDGTVVSTSFNFTITRA